MKRIAKFLVVLIPVILVLWTAGWFAGAHYMRSQIEALATGPTPTTCDSLDISGFPFRYLLDCDGLSVTDGDITLTAQGAQGAAYAFAPNRVLAAIEGPGTFSDAFTGTQRRLDFENVRASLRMWGGMLKRLSVTGDEMTLYDTLIEDTRVASLGHFEFHAIDLPDAYDAQNALMSTHVNFRTDALDIVGTDVTEASIYLDAQISNLPDSVLNWGQPDALPLWQQRNGQIVIETFDAATPQARLGITGELALDELGRPTGELHITSNGVVERLDGLIPPDLAPIITGSPDNEGTYRQTLRLANGVVLAGILPFAMVPPLY